MVNVSELLDIRRSLIIDPFGKYHIPISLELLEQQSFLSVEQNNTASPSPRMVSNVTNVLLASWLEPSSSLTP